MATHHDKSLSNTQIADKINKDVRSQFSYYVVKISNFTDRSFNTESCSQDFQLDEDKLRSASEEIISCMRGQPNDIISQTAIIIFCLIKHRVVQVDYKLSKSSSYDATIEMDDFANSTLCWILMTRILNLSFPGTSLEKNKNLIIAFHKMTQDINILAVFIYATINEYKTGYFRRLRNWRHPVPLSFPKLSSAHGV